MPVKLKLATSLHESKHMLITCVVLGAKLLFLSNIRKILDHISNEFFRQY